MTQENEIEEHTMFMILAIQENATDQKWFIDSGCSNHMTAERKLFVSLDKTFNKDVRTGDDKILKVHGIGDIQVRTKL